MALKKVCFLQPVKSFSTTSEDSRVDLKNSLDQCHFPHLNKCHNHPFHYCEDWVYKDSQNVD